MMFGDVISDVTETLRVPRGGDQHLYHTVEGEPDKGDYWVESCGFPEVASAVLLQAVDMESVVVNTEYLSVGNHG